MDISDYITPAEAASKLGITIQTVRSWIHTGRVTYIKVGGRYRVDKKVLIPTKHDAKFKA